MDMWTSPNSFSFMGVTAHYVDQDFRLHNMLLDFIHVNEKHTGEQLALHLDNCVNSIGIKDKVIILCVWYVCWIQSLIVFFLIDFCRGYRQCKEQHINDDEIARTMEYQ
jgi:hypothetical protein